MTLDPNSSTAAKLESLDRRISALVRSSRRRNTFTVVIGVVSSLLIGYWLYYAHGRFANEVTPQLVANVAQKYVEDYLPTASAQLQESLEANAPHVIDEGEKQLHAVPGHLEEAFRTQVRATLDEEMPKVEDRLYDSMKSGLVQAQQTAAQAGPGQTDEQRFRGMLGALAVVYGTETSKFVDQIHGEYVKNSGNIINGLDMLADGKNLTPQQQTQRNLVRDLLILAKEHTDLPTSPTLAHP